MKSRLLILALAFASSCVFDLAEVVEPGEAGGSGGEGGAPIIYQMEIEHAATMVGDIDDFVVMVALTPERIDYELVRPDGSDLRFFAADGQTPLAHEIESWDPTGLSIVWVKLPTAALGGGTFLLRFGDGAAPGGPDAHEVWSSYVGVYHLADDLSVDSAVEDSSPAAHPGTALGPVSATGFIGGALELDGTGSHVDLGNVPDFDVEPGQQRTFSVWFARRSTAALAMTLGRTKTDCCNGWALRILADPFANIRSDITLGDCCVNGVTGNNTNAFAMPGGAGDMDWHMVASVMDREAGVHAVYLDGVLQSTNDMLPVTGAMTAGAAALGISEYPEDPDPNLSAPFLGVLDEARIAVGLESAERIALRYRAESDQLLTFGPVTIVP